MKGFLPLSDKVKVEMEGRYSLFREVRQELLTQMVSAVKDESREEQRKKLIFATLRKVEGFLSQEASKLKSLPKRSTKFCMYMKRVILSVKLALDSLADKDQVEAYPTLSMIASKFINILLLSTLAENSLPKFVASNLYCFLKTVFCQDLEYVLDAIICSAVLDEADYNKKGIGYYLLLSAAQDEHLYASEVSPFAKLLTVLTFLNQASEKEKDAAVAAIVSNLDRFGGEVAISSVATHFQERYTIKIKHPKTGGWKRMVDSIRPRRVVNVTTRERQSLVGSGEKKKGKGKERATESKDPIKSSSSSSAPDDLFFLDTAGTTTSTTAEMDRDDVVSSTLASHTTDYHFDGSSSPLFLKPWALEKSLLPAFDDDHIGSSNFDFVDTGLFDKDKRSRSRSPRKKAQSSPNKNRSSMSPLKKTRKYNISDDTSDHESDETSVISRNSGSPQKQNSSSEKDSPSPSKPKKSVAISKQDDEDSDLEILFEERAPATGNVDGNDSDMEGSRDEAPSDPEESVVPNYSPSDYIRRRIQDFSDDEDEDTESQNKTLTEDNAVNGENSPQVSESAVKQGRPGLLEKEQDEQLLDLEDNVDSSSHSKSPSKSPGRGRRAKSDSLRSDAGEDSTTAKKKTDDDPAPSPPKFSPRRLRARSNSGSSMSTCSQSSPVRAKSKASKLSPVKEVVEREAASSTNSPAGRTLRQRKTANKPDQEELPKTAAKRPSLKPSSSPSRNGKAKAEVVNLNPPTPKRSRKKTEPEQTTSENKSPPTLTRQTRNTRTASARLTRASVTRSAK